MCRTRTGGTRMGRTRMGRMDERVDGQGCDYILPKIIPGSIKIVGDQWNKRSKLQQENPKGPGSLT